MSGRTCGPARVGADSAPATASTPAETTATGRRRAAVILEVLGGTRSPAQAAEVLGLSVTRYYALEATALAGLSSACEPRPQGRGRPKDPGRERDRLQAEKTRLEAENARYQALLRGLQRTVGVKPAPAASAARDRKTGQGKGRRRRKTTVRALVAARKLRTAPTDTAPREAAEKPVAAAAAVD